MNVGRREGEGCSRRQGRCRDHPTKSNIELYIWRSISEPQLHQQERESLRRLGQDSGLVALRFGIVSL